MGLPFNKMQQKNAAKKCSKKMQQKNAAKKCNAPFAILGGTVFNAQFVEVPQSTADR
jgi:hypothetical protein